MIFLKSVNRSSAEGIKGLLIPVSVIESIHISSDLLREQFTCLKGLSFVMQLKRWLKRNLFQSFHNYCWK